MPRVSVLLNSYNQADYIRDSVEIVLAQTYDDFELIVTDNGSTDQTQSILKQYEGHPKIKLNLFTDNQTVSQRFNQAVALASGEFVAFLYSDDWFLPFKLEHQVSLFDQLGPEYGLVYAPLHVYNQITKKEWDLPTVPAAEDSLKALLISREKGAISPPCQKSNFLSINSPPSRAASTCRMSRAASPPATPGETPPRARFVSTRRTVPNPL